ncbi:hypothetical protein ZWY2020_055740, partial [Hordeum vulgare]
MGEQDTSGSSMVEARAPAKKSGSGHADPRLQGISDAIRVVPHFPKPEIMFNDITALLLRPGVFGTPSTCSWSATAAWASRPSQNVPQLMLLSACLIGLPKFK